MEGGLPGDKVEEIPNVTDCLGRCLRSGCTGFSLATQNGGGERCALATAACHLSSGTWTVYLVNGELHFILTVMKCSKAFSN